VHNTNPTFPPRSIISAVGRSGTTVIHNLLLEIYSDLYGEDYDQLYEPFLWDSAALRDYPRITEREALFGDMDSVSAEGVYYHTLLPLFIDDIDAVHVPVPLKKYLLENSKRPLVAKFIRANGRLPLLDQLYRDARFIVLIRNPLDVANSVVTRFSFFGEENHKSDFPRFRQDIERVFGIKIPADAVHLPAAYKAALWCHFMNLFVVRHAQGKPNYLTIVYEAFRGNSEATARDICTHLGVPYKDSYGLATSSPVGRTSTGQPNLTKSDVDSIMPLFNEYWAMASQTVNLSLAARDRILAKYDTKHLPIISPPARGFGWSPVKAEGQVIKLKAQITEQLSTNRSRIAEVQRTVNLQINSDQPDWRVPISVIITSFNNSETLERAIRSVCEQTYPPQEIIVTDDYSSDNSRQLIEQMAASNPLVKSIFRDTNVGVSANRNDAIQQCESIFVCQLDGDDAYHESKLEREAYALLGSKDSVAFSDTEFMGSGASYWDCSWITGLTGRDAVEGVVSRRKPLPRDMLISKDLFFRAEGYRENCSIFEDWAFKIRLARLAKDWRYSGTPGTLYRPGGLSHSGAEKLMTAALWILSTDVLNLLRETNTLQAAFEGILNLLKVEYNHSLMAHPDIRDQIALKMESFLTDIQSSFSDTTETFTSETALNRAQRLVKTIQLSISAISARG
jgi:hypothetical protein